MNTHINSILNDIKQNTGNWIKDSRMRKHYLIGCIDLIDDVYTICLDEYNNLNFNTCLDKYIICKNQKESPKYDINNIKLQLLNALKNSIDNEIYIYSYNISNNEINKLKHIYSSLETNPCFYLIEK